MNQTKNESQKTDLENVETNKDQCELLEICGFFKKYQAVKDLACRGFIRLYCKGPMMDQCKRKKYREEHGFPPHDDMMPSGHDIIIRDKDKE